MISFSNIAAAHELTFDIEIRLFKLQVLLGLAQLNIKVMKVLNDHCSAVFECMIFAT